MIHMPERYPVIDRCQTGEAIRKHMNERGMSVEDVRRYLNLSSVQSVYHWITGKTVPSTDNLYALSVLFDVPADNLLRGNYSDDDGRLQGD